MAVVQYTGIVNQIRGKVNGSVFNKGKNAFSLQRKQQPPQGGRGLQFESRAIFNQVQRSWKSLSAGDQFDWSTVASNNPDLDRFGNQVVLSGYNKYIQCAHSAIYGGGSIVYPLDTAPAPVFPNVSEVLTVSGFSQSADGVVSAAVDLVITVSNPAYAYYWILDFGLPMSGGVTVYHGRYQFAFGNADTGAGGVSGTVPLGRFYPLPLVGQRVQARLRCFYPGNGVKNFETFFTITI